IGALAADVVRPGEVRAVRRREHADDTSADARPDAGVCPNPPVTVVFDEDLSEGLAGWARQAVGRSAQLVRLAHEIAGNADQEARLFVRWTELYVIGSTVGHAAGDRDGCRGGADVLLDRGRSGLVVWRGPSAAGRGVDCASGKRPHQDRDEGVQRMTNVHFR